MSCSKGTANIVGKNANKKKSKCNGGDRLTVAEHLLKHCESEDVRNNFSIHSLSRSVVICNRCEWYVEVIDKSLGTAIFFRHYNVHLEADVNLLRAHFNTVPYPYNNRFYSKTIQNMPPLTEIEVEGEHSVTNLVELSGNLTKMSL